MLGSAVAQETDDGAEPPMQTVEITGQGSSALISYKALLAGMDAYERHKAKAPDSALYFNMVRNRASVSMKGLTAELVGQKLRLPVTIAANNYLTLQRDAAAQADQADLVVNRVHDALRLEPAVISKSVKEVARRLGDMRLQCMVGHAIARERKSFMARVFTPEVTQCNEMRVYMSPWVARRYTGVVMRDGARVESGGAATISSDGKMVKVRLDDLSWSDDTLIDYQRTPPVTLAPTTPVGVNPAPAS
ncbi:MAG: hypothetical protein ABIT83_26220 [Massilia sp.]